MEQNNPQGFAKFIPNPQPTTPPVSEPVTTPVEDVAPADDIDRDTYTLTVEGVASLLNQSNVDRDRRTIQRWCKSGKVRAVVDTQFGDRYLIDPASVEALVPGLVAEDEVKAKRHQTTSDDVSDDDARRVASPQFTPRHVHMQEENRKAYEDVNADHVAATERDGHTTSHDADDDVATLKKRVAELERENRTLEIDKQVRERYNVYLEESFSKVLVNHDETTLKLGKAQQEIEHLKGMLPAGGEATSQIPFQARDAENQEPNYHVS